MHEDEIIEEYEKEFDAPIHIPRARSNRGFWIVVVTMLLGGILLVVEIFANRPLVNEIGRAQSDLNAAEALATTVRSHSGSYIAADATGLSAADASRRYLGPDSAAAAPGQVSVFAADDSWAAATWVRGGCFYIFLQTGRDPLYGGGGECTGRAALSASNGSW